VLVTDWALMKYYSSTSSLVYLIVSCYVVRLFHLNILKWKWCASEQW
jgi:hypothetical protein